MFSERILKWYYQHKRDLPWRRTTDPYKIWLSEIILQQTRVNQGLPYYYKFIEHFPNVATLANASEDLVLQLWQGLGYYSRGRNLHFSAKLIMENYNGNFPNTSKDIKKLKGVGDYTAAAIASFAYNEPVAAVDGNVIRVISRFYGIEDDISNPKTIKKIQEIAQNELPVEKSADYNQAMMEFGALQCTPKSPQCSTCPLLDSCKAFNYGKVDKLPYKSKKVKVKHRQFNYIVLKANQRLLLQKRDQKDIWQNLYDFPLIESNQLYKYSDQAIADKIHELFEQKIGSMNILVSEDYTHILSHQKIKARFFLIELNQEYTLQKSNTKWVDISDLDNFGKPILIQNYLNKYIL